MPVSNPSSFMQAPAIRPAPWFLFEGHRKERHPVTDGVIKGIGKALPYIIAAIAILIFHAVGQ